MDMLVKPCSNRPVRLPLRTHHMVGAWQRWSGALARSTERDFERLALPFLRLFWPTIDQVPPRRDWDAKGIDLLVWSENAPFPCAVQCKGFAVQDLGPDQLRQIRTSIGSFVRSRVRVHTYLVIHNREGRNREYRQEIGALLSEIVASGQAIKAELWDRHRFLTNCKAELENRIASALHKHAHELLSYYARAFTHGATFVERVPVSEFQLRFRRYEPCKKTLVEQGDSLRVHELVLSPTEARWTLLTGTFGAGKTTTVLHAANLIAGAPVLVECRSLPFLLNELNSTSVLLEQSLKSLRILDEFPEPDRQVIYEISGSTFKAMLKKPGSRFVFILDGLDENRFYSQQRGMEFLSNQLAELRCPIILTTRLEHLNSMFGDFSAAFQEFSTKLAPRRDARLFELQPWSLEQSVSLCDLILSKIYDDGRSRLDEFRTMLSNSTFPSLYGDLPSNPLMLRFIIDDVIENGVHQSTRAALLDSWMRRKIRRDRSAVTRVSIGETVDLEDFVERVIRVMEDVAGRMVNYVEDRLELVETIDEDSVRELAIPTFRTQNDNLLGLVLNSFLLPTGPRSGTTASLAFAFRVVQEYLLARYLRRTGADPEGLPPSVRDFWNELKPTGSTCSQPLA